MVRWADQFKSRMEVKDKLVLSTYRRIPCLATAALQLISSLIVFGIMLYFVSTLRGSHMLVPWTFIINLIVSMISTISLSVMLFVYYPAAPPSKRSFILNGVLICLWVVAFVILTNSMKSTITSKCSVTNWGNGTGVMVCRLYKTLFSFEAIALIATLFGLALDFSGRFSPASSAYIRTTNSKFEVLRGADEDNEYRGLTQGTPSIAPSSAPLYSGAFKSPNTPDDRSLGFPNTPRLMSSAENTELNLLTPLKRRSAGYDVEPSPGLDTHGDDLGEFSYLAPNSTYERTTERGYKLPGDTER